MKRVMCVWFPNWPIQRCRRGSPPGNLLLREPHMDCPSIPDVPLVLFAPADRGKVRVTACSLAARRRGVVPGMLLAEAQSLLPTNANCFAPYDPHADREVLRQLALAGRAFSPWVAIDDAERPDCLLLDVTGCGYGFGGEAGLVAAAVAEMRRRGYWATAAIADTAGAAWAVAHYGIALRHDETRTRIVPVGRTAETLRPLPVEALRLRPDVVALLHEFDLRQIGQVMALRRWELPSRFGPELLLRLDQALGSAPEVLTPERPAEVVEAAWPFEPPIADGQILETVIGRLLEDVLEQLRPQQFGVQRLLFTLALEDHEPLRFPLELLRPTRSLRHLADLVRLHLERQTVPAAVAGVAVRAERVALLEFRQGLLFDGEGADRWRQVTGLLERLSGRLGETAVLRPHLLPDAQPEFAYWCEPWVNLNGKGNQREGVAVSFVANPPSPPPSPPQSRGRGGKRGGRLLLPLPTALRGERDGVRGVASRGDSIPQPDDYSAVFRPPCLKNRLAEVSAVSDEPPTQFHLNGDQYIVANVWGPERIETGWWRGADVRRDYYLVETTAGERFWLFRSLADGAWFLHGVFA